MSLDNPYDAYCFDEAIGSFGNHIDSELMNVTGKTAQEIEAKTERLLGKLLSDKPMSRFADPAVMFDLSKKGKEE